MLVGFRERDKKVNKRNAVKRRLVLVLRVRDVNSGPGEYVFGIVKRIVTWSDAIKKLAIILDA